MPCPASVSISSAIQAMDANVLRDLLHHLDHRFLAAARAEKREHVDRPVDRPIDVVVERGGKFIELAVVDRTVRRTAKVRRNIRRAGGGRARLSVFRSSKHIYAQVIDDVKGETVASASSIEKDMRGSLKSGANVAAAKAVGKLVAERASAKGVTDVVFDRGGYLYHGRVKALADAAREGGLDF